LGDRRSPKRRDSVVRNATKVTRLKLVVRRVLTGGAENAA
jgi:hypothetical protein